MQPVLDRLPEVGVLHPGEQVVPEALEARGGVRLPEEGQEPLHDGNAPSHEAERYNSYV